MVTNRRTYGTPKTYLSHPTSRALGWDKIYIGTVKNTVDIQGMGRLQVWIRELCADITQEENPATWIQVSYASMFGGATNVQDNTNENTFEGTQQSYGWWGIPPDRNVQVGIFFANGDPAAGYWFCCIFDEQMTNMVPGIGGTNSETNRKVIRATTNSAKPKFKPLDDALTEQGLQTDNLRGVSLSSAQRFGDYGTDTVETSLTHKHRPAKVYGLLTPGGNHFVMDDGFTNSKGEVENSLIRFRTRNGSQILIDDTTGFVYFITRDGKTWIEITDQGGGHIDVYSETSISLHAENGDINMKAGNNIIIEAGKSIYVTAGDDILSEAGASYQTKSDGKTVIEARADMNIVTSAVMKQQSGSTFNVLAGGNYLETAPKIHMNGPQASSSELAAKPLLPERVPEHEPWEVHTFKSGSGGFAEGESVSSRAPYEQGTLNSNTAPDTTSVEPFGGLLNGTICGLSDDDTRQYLGALGQRESGSGYNTTNTLNYVGKYQFGAQALEDNGFLKKGSSANQTGRYQSALDDPNNWTGIDGINSKEDFLANGTAQESGMIRYTNRNCTSIQRGSNGINILALPADDKAGLLMAAHLGGPGGAKALWDPVTQTATGTARSDDYGTSTASYFRMGKGALGKSIDNTIPQNDPLKDI